MYKPVVNMYLGIFLNQDSVFQYENFDDGTVCPLILNRQCKWDCIYSHTHASVCDFVIAIKICILG